MYNYYRRFSFAVRIHLQEVNLYPVVTGNTRANYFSRCVQAKIFTNGSQLGWQNAVFKVTPRGTAVISESAAGSCTCMICQGEGSHCEGAHVGGESSSAGLNFYVKSSFLWLEVPDYKKWSAYSVVVHCDVSQSHCLRRSLFVHSLSISYGKMLTGWQLELDGGLESPC